MIVYKGKGVYGAVAIGRVSVFKRQAAAVRRTVIKDTAAELARIETAKQKAV
jgi:phosphotransferase system enzyme I (PtsI)